MLYIKQQAIFPERVASLDLSQCATVADSDNYNSHENKSIQNIREPFFPTKNQFL
jgi:hypothetical protein